jgi:hypothetical protein
MKRVVLFFLFGCLSVIAFASFPVETQIMLTEVDPEGFKLDTWGFIIGILSSILLPYSLLLLFIRKKSFRGSLAWGWLAGLVLIVLIVIFSFSVDEFKFLY